MISSRTHQGHSSQAPPALAIPIQDVYPSINVDQLLLTQDRVNLQCLEYVCSNDQGSLIKELSQHVGLSRGAVLKRMQTLTEQGLVTRQEIAHANPKMPSTFVYRSIPELNLEAIQLQLRQVSPIASRRPRGSELIDLDQASIELPSSECLLLKESVFRTKIEKIRSSMRSGYFQLVEWAVEYDGLTMISASELSGKQRQTVHAQLKRLADLGILDRKYQDFPDGHKEYVYRLSSAISPSEVSSYGLSYHDKHMPDQIAEKQPVNLPYLVENTMINDNLQIPASAQTVSAQELAKLMSMFDPSWNDDWKSIWFAAVKKIVDQTS
jgi:predicted transcriptional regulator